MWRQGLCNANKYPAFPVGLCSPHCGLRRYAYVAVLSHATVRRASAGMSTQAAITLQIAVWTDSERKECLLLAWRECSIQEPPMWVLIPSSLVENVRTKANRNVLAPDPTPPPFSTRTVHVVSPQEGRTSMHTSAPPHLTPSSEPAPTPCWKQTSPSCHAQLFCFSATRKSKAKLP